MEDFGEFMRRREEAAQAYVVGDPKPLDALVVHEGAATFFHPRGGYKTGAAEVWQAYESDAAAFGPGSTTNFEILEMAASGDLAYWVGVQRASVRFAKAGADADPTPMDIRVTEVFRRIDGEWKMVHRHADPSVSRE